MQFLYVWVTKGHTSNLRKGMVEELEAFVNNEVSNEELARSANAMQEKAIKLGPPVDDDGTLVAAPAEDPQDA